MLEMKHFEHFSISHDKTISETLKYCLKGNISNLLIFYDHLGWSCFVALYHRFQLKSLENYVILASEVFYVCKFHVHHFVKTVLKLFVLGSRILQTSKLSTVIGD